MSHSISQEAAMLASLYLDALRQGQPIWFRVISESMHPLIKVDDTIYVEPATASTLFPGSIAAFTTPYGLVVHRILSLRRSPTLLPSSQDQEHITLLEMGDARFSGNWLPESAIIGQVTIIQNDSRRTKLHHPIAKRWGRVTAALRYRLYLLYISISLSSVQFILRKLARTAVFITCWRIHHSGATTTFAEHSPPIHHD